MNEWGKKKRVQEKLRGMPNETCDLGVAVEALKGNFKPRNLTMRGKKRVYISDEIICKVTVSVLKVSGVSYVRFSRSLTLKKEGTVIGIYAIRSDGMANIAGLRTR